jgi:predicted RNA binding protein YcfA (HicA-like mRNA interferase family)
VKLPRDLSGAELARALGAFGYRTTRQTGSHMRLTTSTPAEHHVTVPAHAPLKLGTLRAILGEVAAAQKLDIAELARQLFEN